MTALLGVLSLALMGRLGFTALPDPIFSLAGWFGIAIQSAGVFVAVYVVSLMRQGVDRPIRLLLDKANANRRLYAVAAIGMTLAGFDLYFFMIMKPELNVLFPFRADTYLAGLDHAMFETDAWRLLPLAGLNIIALTYNPLWYVAVIAALLWVMVKPPSATKTASIRCYFVLWSLFGPIGQALLSSAGPVFYERIGLGDRFSGMPQMPFPTMIADYLWHSYQTRSLAPGAGISAMPSLHIATAAWIAISFAAFRSRWAVPAVLFALYLWVGSVALGWHYASDGLVGALGALSCFYLSGLSAPHRMLPPILASAE